MSAFAKYEASESLESYPLVSPKPYSLALQASAGLRLRGDSKGPSLR